MQSLIACPDEAQGQNHEDLDILGVCLLSGGCAFRKGVLYSRRPIEMSVTPHVQGAVASTLAIQLPDPMEEQRQSID